MCTIMSDLKEQLQAAQKECTTLRKFKQRHEKEFEILKLSGGKSAEVLRNERTKQQKTIQRRVYAVEIRIHSYSSPSSFAIPFYKI